MSCYKALFGLFLSPLLTFAAGAVMQGIPTSGEHTQLNGRWIAARQSQTPKKSGVKDVVVFTGDTVIPHVVDGGGWKTSFTFINFEPHTVHFSVLFMDDDGYDYNLNVVGLGRTYGVVLTLPANNTITFETADTGQLTQGWGYILADNSADSIGGMAVFRQRVAGRPDFEAVVPVVSEFDGHFLLVFDNVGFTTAAAIANPHNQSINVPYIVRDDNGNILHQDTFAMDSYTHSAFTFTAQWPETAGKRGTVEFKAPGLGLGALGLRFGAASFTSFHTLQSFDWAME